MVPVPGTGTIGSDNCSIVSTFLLAKMLTNLLKPPEEIFLLTPLPTYRYLLTYHTYLWQGRARGNRAGLWVRSKLQEELYQLGRLIQRHAGKVLFTGVLLLASLTIGLKSVILEVRVVAISLRKHFCQVSPPIGGKNSAKYLQKKFCWLKLEFLKEVWEGNVL